jgi:hypothetical protein
VSYEPDNFSKSDTENLAFLILNDFALAAASLVIEDEMSEA